MGVPEMAPSRGMSLERCLLNSHSLPLVSLNWFSRSPHQLGRLGWQSMFRIADDVRTDIGDCPYWTTSLVWSRPSMSTSRQSVSQVGKETFPNWLSRSIQTASKAGDGQSKPIFETPHPRPTDQKLARTSNSVHSWQ